MKLRPSRRVAAWVEPEPEIEALEWFRQDLVERVVAEAQPEDPT